MKFKLKLRGKLICTILFPVLLLGIAVMQLSKVTVSNVLEDKLDTSLHATAISVSNTLMHMDEGDFLVNDAGELVKGEHSISGHMEMVDSIKRESDVDVSVFYGDTRYLTTLTDETGKRIVGEKASQEVIDKVLKGGESYFIEEAELGGKPYLAYYMPLYNEGGKTPVGMVFTGISRSHVDEGGKIISYNISTIIFVVVLGILVINNIYSVRKEQQLRGKKGGR